MVMKYFCWVNQTTNGDANLCTYRKVSLVLKTDWPCKPVPCRTNRWLKSPCSCMTCTLKISLPRYSDKLAHRITHQKHQQKTSTAIFYYNLLNLSLVTPSGTFAVTNHSSPSSALFCAAASIFLQLYLYCILQSIAPSKYLFSSCSLVVLFLCERKDTWFIVYHCLHTTASWYLSELCTYNRHTMLQQLLRRQIIRSSRSACVERPSCYPSQHRADNGHFLQTSQHCFVYYSRGRGAFVTFWYYRAVYKCPYLPTYLH